MTTVGATLSTVTASVSESEPPSPSETVTLGLCELGPSAKRALEAAGAGGRVEGVAPRACRGAAARCVAGEVSCARVGGREAVGVRSSPR